MFGLDDAEVQKRRRYVGHVRKEIEVSLLSLSALLRSYDRLTIIVFASPEHENKCQF